mgnify:CR=1 FL=1
MAAAGLTGGDRVVDILDRFPLARFADHQHLGGGEGGDLREGLGPVLVFAPCVASDYDPTGVTADLGGLSLSPSHLAAAEQAALQS